MNGARLARLVFLGTCGLYGVALGWSWYLLPDSGIPLHYGAGGEADRWGSRTEAVVTMAAVGGGTALVLAGTAWLVQRSPKGMINLPRRHRKWWFATPERTRELSRRMAADVCWMGVAVMLLLLVVLGIIVRDARGGEASLGSWFWVFFAGWLVAVLGYASLMVVRYRPPDERGEAPDGRGA